MKKIGFSILIGLTLSFSLIFGQETYKWVDEKGTVHFTDDLDLVPEKYRDQIQKDRPPKEPAARPSTQPPKPTETEKKAEFPSVQKDALGRGEEWWRARVREWNEKFMSAHRNYENTYSEWKAKEKELEASKFKPDSLKRKLKAEMKALEEKTKDWEKQVEEAKNMLEKVLPKEAQDYRANPEWLNLEERK